MLAQSESQDDDIIDHDEDEELYKNTQSLAESKSKSDEKADEGSDEKADEKADEKSDEKSEEKGKFRGYSKNTVSGRSERASKARAWNQSRKVKRGRTRKRYARNKTRGNVLSSSF